MIEIQTNDSSALIEATISGHLRADDFGTVAPQVDEFIEKHEKVSVLLDLTEFHGWENITAARSHFTFIKDHHKRIERIAVVANKTWQHWISAVIGTFISSKEKCFDENQKDDARNWLTSVTV